MAVINAEMSRSLWWQVWPLLLIYLLSPLPVQAFKSVEAQSVAQITFDDEGNPLDYPAAVFFDPDQEELYVVNGGSGRIIVYGPDYFPRWSIGSGREVFTPRGGMVLADGRVYALQVKNRANPIPRITVLNGAFFPEQDIPLDNIPGVKDFVPRNLAISASGLMYVSGDLYRGVLVLDNEGYFLRKLQPTDKVSALSQNYVPEAAATEEGATAPSAEAVEKDEFANIPEEFRPRKSLGVRTGGSEVLGVGPVKINYVTIDSQGRIYMVCPETGKIYVHDAEERFLFAFGTKGGSPGQLSNPRALVIDETRGLIYVADYMRHSILAYSMSGEYLFETGGRGETPGWFNFPNDIALTSRGELIVADLFNRRVQVLHVDYDARFFNLEELLKADPQANETELPQAGSVPADPEFKTEKSSDPAIPVEIQLNPQQGANPAIDVEKIQEEAIPEKTIELNEQNSKPGSFLENTEPTTDKLVNQELLAIETASLGAAIPLSEAGSLGKSDTPAELKVETATGQVFSEEKPDFSKVDDFIKFWVKSWEGQNIAAYLSCYRNDFTSPGISRDQWEKQRAERIGTSSKMEIQLSDLKKKKLSADRIQVTFVQDYRSSTYADVSLKSLELIWVGEGWAIAQEASQAF